MVMENTVLIMTNVGMNVGLHQKIQCPLKKMICVTIATIVIFMISEHQYAAIRLDRIFVSVKSIMLETGPFARIEKNVKARRILIVQYTQIVLSILVTLSVTVS